MTQHMISQSQEALFGFVFAVESLKSVVLALAVMDGRVGVEEAVNLSRLEVDYQVGNSLSCDLSERIDRLIH